MANLVGRTLKNRYRVDEFLGRGGMAEVYRVYDLQRGVPLAMKLLREDLAEDRVFMRRFAREAQNLTRLQHPNIVRCYGLEQAGRTAYMLMDYIDGCTLRAELSDVGRPLPAKNILEILRPICSALDYAHQMGVVHCDVKSANIMINSSGKVFLTDFGVARSLDAATSTMVGVGTPAYMAPELIMGKDPVPQSDIYSLGIVLFEMLTGGERPFTGERAAITGTTAEKVRWEHLNLEPLRAGIFNQHIPAGMDEIIDRCLAKEPLNRYPSAINVYEQVVKVFRSSPQSRVDLEERSLKNFGNQFEKRPENATHRGSGQKSSVAIIGVLLLALFLLLIFFMFLPGRDIKSNTAAVNEKIEDIPTNEVLSSDENTPSQVPTLMNEPAQESRVIEDNAPNGKIVFTCQVDKTIGHDQICLINPDGSGEKQLTNDLTSKNYYPSLFENGSKIIFSSSMNGGFELFSMDIDGNNQRQLTANHGEFYSSDVSPDGKFIVATRNQNGENHITLLNIDGSFIKDLNSYYDCKEPVWSPDGDEILFAANPKSEGMQLYIMDKDGNNIRKITNISNLTGRADWGPNGQMASFSGVYEKHNRELFLFSENGSIEFITSGGDNLAPSFSPDGNWIAFTSYRDDLGNPDGCEIYIMRLGDGLIKRVTQNDYCDYQPRWGR